MKHQALLLLLVAVGAMGCGRLDAIPFHPPLLASAWCEMQPCMQLFGWVISQPSSSMLVLFAALASIALARYFAQTANGHESRWWFAVSMLAGGVGALLAGISYQAFGYELKCAGRAYCVWTNWWELGYELLTVFGASALFIAVVASCLSKPWQKVVQVGAMLNALVYLCILIVGVLTLDRFLISFEMMLLFTAPTYLFLLLFNAFQYYKERSALMKRYVLSWLILFATLGAFFAYASAGITNQLWAHGIWFSENDVLHLGMLVWMYYIWKFLGPEVKDFGPAA